MINFKFKYLSLLVSMVLLLTSCSNLDIQTLNLKAKQLMEQGDVDGAIGRLESINDLNPKYPQTHYNLGIAYYKKGEFDKAINSLNQSLKLDSKLADAYYSLGVIYEDIALSEIDNSTKEDKKIEKPEILNKIIQNLQNSHESFVKYLDLTQNSAEQADIKTKIENLNNEITKYQSIMTEKYGATR